jgi:acyl carrier protein
VSEADNNYELDILRMVINQFLDESTSLTESSLNALETRRDQVVWDLTTRIYRQSGYRVELSLVRDIVNSRIRIIKNHLAEEAPRIIERKAQREAEISRHISEQKAQQEAEEARRISEQKAQQEAEEARRISKQKAQQKVQEARRAAESNPQFLARRKSEIFVRVRKVISKHLSVDEEEVTLKSHLSIDFAADPLDLLELSMALEEEFDIEISDEDFTNTLDLVYPTMGSFVTPSGGKIGEKAIVGNVVELIWGSTPSFWEMPHNKFLE